jgi:hypothetical protein
MRRQIIAEQLEAALRTSLQAPALRVVSLDGERPSVDARREPWIEIKYGPASPDDWFGIVPARAQFERSAGKAREVLSLIVKVNPRLGLARNLIPWIIENKSIRLDRPYWEYRTSAETDRTADREFHVYELAASGSSALSRILPRYYGAASDPATGERALFMVPPACRRTGRLRRSAPRSPRRRLGRRNFGGRIMLPWHGPGRVRRLQICWPTSPCGAGCWTMPMRDFRAS